MTVEPTVNAKLTAGEVLSLKTKGQSNINGHFVLYTYTIININIHP